MKKLGIVMFLLAGLAYISHAQYPKYLYGIASWYGDEYAGKKTASGEVYDPEKLTAAHKTLPFGSEVEVENLENGKKVTVIVNDRGPFVENRDIDISRKAAEKIDLINKGTTFVKMTVIKLGDTPSSTVIQETNKPAEVTPTVDTNKPAEITPTTTTTPATNTRTVTPATTTPATTSNTVIKPASTTNVVVITNYYDPSTSTGALTNRMVEKTVDLNDKAYDDEFIRDEPLEDPDITLDDFNPVSKPVSNKSPASKNVVNLDTIDIDFPIATNGPPPALEVEKRISDKPASTDAVVNGGDVPIMFDETEVTPEILLSDVAEKAIKVEEKEIQSELDKEVEIKEETYPQDEKEEKAIETEEFKPVKVVEPVQSTEPVFQPAGYGVSYAVQVGAFAKEANAEKAYNKLRAKGYPVFKTYTTVKKKRFIRVRLGYYNSQEKANSVVRELRHLGFEPIIIKLSVDSK